jgi:uncharacterized protein YfeS
MKSDSRPRYRPIDKKYGNLPLTIEIDTAEMTLAGRAGLHDLLKIVVLRVLIDAAHHFDRPADQLVALLEAMSPTRETTVSSQSMALMEDSGDDDILSDPTAAHPRAQDLMTEEFFWDCVDEVAPFGSDEGDTALYEFRDWRESHPNAALTECLSWIMNGRLTEYNEGLLDDSQIAQDLKNPDRAFLADLYDMFTLDAAVIATGLAQLIFEGRIDREAKPYVRVAVRRQLNPQVVSNDHRAEILRAVLRVIEAA